jgi:hypothetical protein
VAANQQNITSCPLPAGHRLVWPTHIKGKWVGLQIILVFTSVKHLKNWAKGDNRFEQKAGGCGSGEQNIT